MTVYGISQNKLTKVAPSVPLEVAGRNYDGLDMNRFRQFWDLMDAIQIHGYIRAAMSVIGRSAVGAWWNLVKSKENPGQATERQRKRLMQFYTMPTKKWDNIKDFQSNTYKIMIGAMYLRYFGQCGYQIVRNELGQAVGYDFLPGFIYPNVDNQGYFKSPAFVQYPTKDTRTKVEFDSARDIIYIVNPDWTGKPTGGSDIEALTDFAIPTDIYLQTAAREYMKNRDKPEGFFVLPSDVSDEAFNAFVQAIQARYAGPANIGRSPITVAGELDFKEVSKMPTDLPYQDARADTRQELLAVSGVAGAKLGLTDAMAAGDLQEARREFHESTMVPLFRLIETALYEQVHIREFGISGWEYKFGNPDFLNAVEKATVHMRYIQTGVYSPNDARRDLGMLNRKDGDVYVDPTGKQKKEQNAEQNPVQNPQGNPPEGRQERPDAPSKTGEPTLDNQDPPRGDQHDNQNRKLLDIEDDLRRWKVFATKRLGKKARKFETEIIPDYLYSAIEERLVRCETAQEINSVFAEILSLLEEAL